MNENNLTDDKPNGGKRVPQRRDGDTTTALPTKDDGKLPSDGEVIAELGDELGGPA